MCQGVRRGVSRTPRGSGEAGVAHLAPEGAATDAERLRGVIAAPMIGVEHFPQVVEQINNSLLLAVDIPSGVDADTGEVGEVGESAVHADITVTFGAYKPGLLISPGAEHAGELAFVDIGLTLEGAPVLEALEAADVQALLPVTSAESNKYRRGVVGAAMG